MTSQNPGPEQVRPEVVQALFNALTDMDLAKIASLAETLAETQRTRDGGMAGTGRAPVVLTAELGAAI